MSILIKGLDMPGVFCGADIVLYEGINGSGVPRKYKISADQVVHVPPHGRLVDADALAVKITKRKRPTLSIGEDGSKDRIRFIMWQSMISAVDEAPTIIPADLAEEGEL